MGNASASATTSTVISVESTESSFINSLFVLLRLNDDCAIFSYATNNFIYMFLLFAARAKAQDFTCPVNQCTYNQSSGSTTSECLQLVRSISLLLVSLQQVDIGPRFF